MKTIWIMAWSFMPITKKDIEKHKRMVKIQNMIFKIKRFFNI